MALARVVSFEGVGKDRIDEIRRGMSERQQPEGVPAKEVVVLHDPEAEEVARDPLLRDGGRLQAR